MTSNAARRISASLKDRGIWVAADVLWVEDAARACERYLALVEHYGAADDPTGLLAEMIETARRNARDRLADVLMIPDARLRIGLVNVAGVDADIAAVCRPWPEGD